MWGPFSGNQLLNSELKTKGMLRALHSEFSGPPGVGPTTLPRRLLATTFKLVSFTGGLESREVAFGGL